MPRIKSGPLRKRKTDKAIAKVVEPHVVQSLSPTEEEDLKACEKVIENGWTTFLEVGRALSKVRDSKLYRTEHTSFEDYCRTRWQYGKSHAYRLIQAAEVVTDVSPTGDIPPSSESQVRPLIQLPKDDRIKAWKAALKAAGDKTPTAKIVKEAATGFLPPKRRQKKAGSKESAWTNTIAALKAAQKAANGNKTVLSSLAALEQCLKEIKPA